MSFSRPRKKRKTYYRTTAVKCKICWISLPVLAKLAKTHHIALNDASGEINSIWLQSAPDKLEVINFQWNYIAHTFLSAPACLLFRSDNGLGNFASSCNLWWLFYVAIIILLGKLRQAKWPVCSLETQSFRIRS